MSNIYDKNNQIVYPNGSIAHSRFVDSRPQKAEDHRRMHTPIVRTERKIGRNDPCPCRSGRKYKKCHGK